MAQYFFYGAEAIAEGAIPKKESRNCIVRFSILNSVVAIARFDRLHGWVPISTQFKRQYINPKGIT
jgi:hypothetical protein